MLRYQAFGNVLGWFTFRRSALGILVFGLLGSAHLVWSEWQEQQLVQALIVKLKDPDVVRRVDAARDLARLKAEAEAAIPALIEGLEDENFNVRWRSAHALGEIGHQASPALPALERVSKEENLFSSWAAAEAIGKINQRGK